MPEAERLEAVKFAVSLGDDVNARANFGDYPMDGDVAYTLLYYPHNIDNAGRPRRGRSALERQHAAHRRDHVEPAVDRAVSSSIKAPTCNTKTTLGWTPLNVAEGVFCCNAKKEFPAAAAIIRKALGGK